MTIPEVLFFESPTVNLLSTKPTENLLHVHATQGIGELSFGGQKVYSILNIKFTWLSQFLVNLFRTWPFLSSINVLINHQNIVKDQPMDL